MEFLGLDVAIWVVLALYFAGMLVLGWFCKRGIRSHESFLLGNRQFGVPAMVMHAFGAGTNPSDTTGTISNTVSAGASGIWVSWMWMFGTPFYWIIAPVVRRMRCLTMADYFQERFGNSAAVLYTVTSGVAMTIFFAAVLLGTTRTVQGMMGIKFIAEAGRFDWWFYAILFVTTVTFMLYGYWGGIVAAVRTDMIQGLMIIVLSVLAIRPALNLEEVGGLSGMRQTLAAANSNYLNLFGAGGGFSLWKVILLCISAPLTALALPHLMSVCGAGRTEWEGRMGFTYGNMLKRICTIGWSVLGLCWLAYLIKSESKIYPDAALGDCIRHVLPPVAQGLMLACIMAAAMSSGDAVQVTVAGLFTQSIYRRYVNTEADQHTQVKVTRIAGLFIILLSLLFAILMRNAFVQSIVAYFRILSFIGIAVAMGILWRRTNSSGVFGCILSAIAVYVFIQLNRTRGYVAIPDYLAAALPLAAGLLGGIVGSLAGASPDEAVLEKFFTKIYVPVGQEHKLTLGLDQAVPQSNRMLTAGGLFIVRPCRQSTVGFVVAAAVCVACVLVMLAILNF
jgi:Na+/proline symporter